MNQYALYSKDNNNIKIVNLLQKNIMMQKYSTLSLLIKKIRNIIITKEYNCMIIKTFMVVRQS